jgi:D-lactate dehydrogenase (cytochrome)
VIQPAQLFRDAGLAVNDDPADRAVLSSDIANMAATPAAAILRPAHEDDVATLVRVARSNGVALYPRGGGWSYTNGYRPGDAPAALVDCTALQGIAIDREAKTVTVGAGTRWTEMHDALAAAGLRATSFGPLSGFGATIGGSAAQNGGFFGAATHGAMGDGGIIGGRMITGVGVALEMTLSDRVDGLIAPQPLVGDCGAFGIRTQVTLRVIDTPATTRFASFNFPHGADAFAILAQFTGFPTLGEAYVFDPGTHANLSRSGFSVIESAGLAADLLGGTGGILGRLGGLLRTARAGKAFVADLAWSLHLSFDGTEAETRAALLEATRLALAAGGEIVPDVIPRVTRARPFRRIKALLGPDGEAWLPVHGVFAPADIHAALAGVQAELANSAPEMQAHDIRCVLLGVLMGTRLILEPQLFWPDALTPALARMVTAEQAETHGANPAHPKARAAAHALRRRLIDVLDAHGATHFQIGRSYAAHPGVPAAAIQSWRDLKRRHDPDAIMNPGVLGI